MDTSTGHLIDRSAIDLYELRRRGLDPSAYSRVPDRLAGAAKRKLRGRAESHVSLTSGGRLSKWAADRRRAAEKTRARRRKRNRIARESRRKNRRR